MHLRYHQFLVIFEKFLMCKMCMSLRKDFCPGFSLSFLLFLYLIERDQFCMESTINNEMQSVSFLKVYFFLINKW